MPKKTIAGFKTVVIKRSRPRNPDWQVFWMLNVLCCIHLTKSKFDPHTGPQNHWFIYIEDMKKEKEVYYHIHILNILSILTFAPAICLSVLFQQFSPHLLSVFETV